jgi:diadenosine tetraphosphate (Ap4A) HIT family hydrolase
MQFDRAIWENKISKEKIIWKENCPFCHIVDDEKKLILFETKYWEIRYNKYPYWWIKNHLLLFPKRHIELAKELNKDELSDLENIHKYLYNFYDKQQYFSFIRETFEWRSIKHLHYHYLPWNIHWDDFAKILNKKN